MDPGLACDPMHPVAARLQAALTDRPWLAPFLLSVLAGLVLLLRLGDPGRIIFDETYYVDDARGYLDTGVEPGFAVHPTVGKWLIAGSIWLFGDTPFGWRAAGAVAGIAIVVLTYLLARRLLADSPDGWWLALVAPVLLLADGLFITQARIAMLDIFLALFALAGLLALVADRQHRREMTEDQEQVLSLRVLAGVLFGLAIGVKWSGLLALGGAGLLTLGWEIGAARGRAWFVFVGRLLATTISLVVVPFLVYVATWTPWLVNYADTFTAGCEEPASCEYRLGERLSGLVRHHDQMLDFHLGLEASHNYRSDPLGWPVLQRPVVYWWSTCSAEDASASPTFDPETGTTRPVCDVDEGDAGEVLAIGNPALWWGFLLLTPLLVAGTVLRDRRSAVALVTWLATWLPWLVVSRTAFLFYLVPVVPLLAIGAVIALERLGAPGAVRRTYVGAVLGAAVPLALVGALVLVDAVEGPRWVFGLAAAGWAIGAAVGAVADRQARVDDRTAAVLAGPVGDWPAPVWTPPGDERGLDADPPGRRTTGRWVAGFTAVVLGTAVFFAPVWLAIPLEEDAVRARWWFDSWI